MGVTKIKEWIIIKILRIFTGREYKYFGPIRKDLPNLFPRITGHCGDCDYPIFQGVEHIHKTPFNKLYDKK